MQTSQRETSQGVGDLRCVKVASEPPLVEIPSPQRWIPSCPLYPVSFFPPPGVCIRGDEEPGVGACGAAAQRPRAGLSKVPGDG